MRYWLDTEFIEDGKTIDLISIGMVSEDNRELYLMNVDCDWTKASPWVKDNVLSQLPPKPADFEFSEIHRQQGWIRRSNIADVVHEFLQGDLERIQLNQEQIQIKRRIIDEPEIWADYADYDWVAFCQLFGTMMDLPQGYPMYCRDIKQECDRLGNPELPTQTGSLHHALEDAKWGKQCWEYLRDLQK